MDCDNQIGLVKCDHDPHANTPDLANVAKLSVLVRIDLLCVGDNPLDVGNGRAQMPEIVLRVSRETHTCLRAQRGKLSPSTFVRRDEFSDPVDTGHRASGIGYPPQLGSKALRTRTLGLPPP